MQDLSIIRNELNFEGRYTQIPNEWIRDTRISFKAKGVLHLLLSHKSGWRTSISHLSSVGKDGRDAVRTAIIELEESGYLVRSRIREGGKLGGSEWRLTDPFDAPPMTDFPMQEKPMLENPMQENPTLKNTNTKKTNNLKKTNIEDIYTQEAFELFWKTYPRKTAKGQARDAYKKALAKISPQELQEAIEKYRQDPNLPEDQFIPHASTWLNQERWSDGALPPRVRKPVSNENAKDIFERAKKLQEQMEGGAKEIEHKGDRDDTELH